MKKHKAFRWTLFGRHQWLDVLTDTQKLRIGVGYQYGIWGTQGPKRLSLSVDFLVFSVQITF